MGNSAGRGLQQLSSLELSFVARALELDLIPDARVHGILWPGEAPEIRNYRVMQQTNGARGEPLQSMWVAERAGDVFRMLARPANRDEILELLEALREVRALEPEISNPVAEAQYDCRERTYQLSFTSLDAMLEGVRYKRWIFRRHGGGRPLSVGYVLETRSNAAHVALSGGEVLRGSPWD